MWNRCASIEVTLDFETAAAAEVQIKLTESVNNQYVELV